MSGLKLGAHMSIAGGVSNALDAAADVQSNAVQVFMKSNRQWAGPQVKAEDVSRWNEQMPASGVAYAVSHASYLINLASPKDPLWEKSIDAYMPMSWSAPTPTASGTWFSIPARTPAAAKKPACSASPLPSTASTPNCPIAPA